MTTPAQLCVAARVMLERPGTLGPRAGVILARQALEEWVDQFWVERGYPSMVHTSWRAKFVALPSYLPESRQGSGPHLHLLWSQLSALAHHHPYELTLMPEEVAPLVNQTAEAVA